jgi:hypothetical protein
MRSHSAYSTTGGTRTVGRYRAFEFACPANTPDTFLITEDIVSVAPVTLMEITHGWLRFTAWKLRSNGRGRRSLRRGLRWLVSLVRRGSRRRLGRGMRRGRRDVGALGGILLLLVSLSSVSRSRWFLSPYPTASTVVAWHGSMLESWLQRELSHESNQSLVASNHGLMIMNKGKNIVGEDIGLTRS